MKWLASAVLLTISNLTLATGVQGHDKPNIILMMADDLGYGDTGFNGNTIIQTPHLDQMAQDGVIMSNFHAAAPVCSPTRGSVMTGRQPFRYGIFSANEGHLPGGEITIPELLKTQGYATGHFGKWHLGTLSKTMSAKGAKRRPAENYSPPALHGYDMSFVTESAVSTWNPTEGGRAKNNPFWHNGKALPANEPSLKGGAGRVVMDRALDFIKQQAMDDKPFFTVIWFHAPHAPVVAGPKYLAMYPEHGAAAHYYGAVTEMDEQIGRLRALLKKLDVEDNTFISFTSDNGPEGKQIKNKHAGVTAGLRGRKRSLYEGGVRVPTVMLYPKQLPTGIVVDTPASTLDYLPTVLAMTGIPYPDDRPIDGSNIFDVIKGKAITGRNIPFYHNTKLALVQDHYKLLINSAELNSAELYDLNADIFETNNIAHQEPARVNAMTQALVAYKNSFKQSHSGSDYPSDSAYTPVSPWPKGKLSKSERQAKKLKSIKSKKTKGKSIQ